MMCENLRAFLDDELSAIGRLVMSARLRLCGRCRLNAAEWQRLSRQIEQLEDEPVPPALGECVHADALLAAASARTHGPSLPVQQSRRQGVMTMRRTVMAVVFLGVLAGVALWQLPGRRGDTALAAVARAMANVTSAHFVGSTLDRGTGQRRSVEGWVKGRKFRMVTEGTEDVVDDGNRLVTLSISDNLVMATISPPGEYVGLSEGMTYLDLFRGVLLEPGMEAVRWEAIRLPDGRQAKKAILISPGSPGLAKGVLIVDVDTDLLLGLEEYDSAGSLVDKLERIEYNVAIPDSTFQVSIPENAVVTDETAPPSPASVEGWKEVEAAIKKLEAEGAYLIWKCPPRKGPAGLSDIGDFHPNLRFQLLDNKGTAMLYTPQNTYIIFGRVLVEDVRGPFRRVLTNEEFAAPTPPIVSIEQWKAQRAREEARIRAESKRHMPPPEVRAQWDAKGKELVAAGARLLVRSSGHCWPVGNANRFGIANGGCDFEALNKGAMRQIRIWYSPARKEYYIMGKARIHGPGFDQTVEDGWIKVPGPAPKLRQD
ncbi:MAG TPA: hypothetical protein VM221_13775 [Armatimonadota bacterium]|nr:hypothetical protein [Armatimonadota bacterium]